jgi:hypothetical protein
MRLQPTSLRSEENALGKSLKNEGEGVDAAGIRSMKTDT